MCKCVHTESLYIYLTWLPEWWTGWNRGHLNFFPRIENYLTHLTSWILNLLVLLNLGLNIPLWFWGWAGRLSRLGPPAAAASFPSASAVEPGSRARVKVGSAACPILLLLSPACTWLRQGQSRTLTPWRRCSFVGEEWFALHGRILVPRMSWLLLPVWILLDFLQSK